MLEHLMMLAPVLLPVLWFIFRLEKHISNDSRVETKLDKIIENQLKGRK